MTTGTEIAGITVDGTRTAIYAPASSGGGGQTVVVDGGAELNLLESITLSQAASIINVNVESGKHIHDKFYIEALFEKNNPTSSSATNVNIALGTSANNKKAVSYNNALNTNDDTYFVAYGQRGPEGKWIVYAKTGNSFNALPNGAGVGVGNFNIQANGGYGQDVVAEPTVLQINASSGSFGVDTIVKVYANLAND